MKTAFFTSKNIESSISIEEKFNICGLNSGNLIFRESLKNILEMDIVNYNTSNEVLQQYDQFVTTELIWIRENVEMPFVEGLLNKVGERPLIPISVGLQSHYFNPSFKLHPSVINILKNIGDRCVIGVRGEYTAEILNKHDIKNIKIIGCPSLYYNMDYDFKINKKDNNSIKKVNTMFRTFYGDLKKYEKHFLTYCANHNYSFVEQTKQCLSLESVNDEKMFNYINEWLNIKKNIFFSAEDWKKYMYEFDFCMGPRFHGNVVALWSRIPALFMTIDSRTKEMCDYFDLPTLELEKFDMNKPIEYYYDLANYDNFNKNYSKKLDKFIEFCKGNNLDISCRIDKYYDRKITNLTEQLEIIKNR